MNNDNLYSSQKAKNLAIKNVPLVSHEATIQEIKAKIKKHQYENIDTIYIVSETAKERVLGYVATSTILAAGDTEKISAYVKSLNTYVYEDADQEAVAIEAIKKNVSHMPVLTKHDKFVGVITPTQLLQVLHQEHLEDLLIAGGVNVEKTNILDLLKNNVAHGVIARAPWLLVGLTIGLVLGFITRFFEHALQETIALVFFIPVIAYIAGSVGAQSGTILIRALTVYKIDYKKYLLKELAIALALGTILGTLGGIGALFISQSTVVAQIVSLALFLAVTFSSTFGCLVPIALMRFNSDPAIASGPLATAIQDAISLLIYFLLAVWLT